MCSTAPRRSMCTASAKSPRRTASTNCGGTTWKWMSIDSITVSLLRRPGVLSRGLVQGLLGIRVVEDDPVDHARQDRLQLLVVRGARHGASDREVVDVHAEEGVPFRLGRVEPSLARLHEPDVAPPLEGTRAEEVDEIPRRRALVG